ncbi:hypothetical protein C8R44DRAFT_740594 [Mycena epipterygia]|nr:hypothetical protein C8R44DRAFT_740594 [Mycena epipterygia]
MKSNGVSVGCLRFALSTAADAINHGDEDGRNVPNIAGKQRNDGGSTIVINGQIPGPRTSQAISQATPSTPAPPNLNSAKRRKPFSQAIPKIQRVRTSNSAPITANPPSMPLVVFENTARQDATGEISTFRLNRSFDFASIGDNASVIAAYSGSTAHTIFNTNRATSWRAPAGSKTYLIQHLMRHRCTEHCTAKYLVFINKLWARPGPFIPHSVVGTMNPGSPLTLSSMEDLNALPMYLDNQILVDEDDGIAHVSTYLLNSSYDFVEVVNPVTLATLYHADIGVKFIAVHLTNVAAFVAWMGAFDEALLFVHPSICLRRTRPYRHSYHSENAYAAGAGMVRLSHSFGPPVCVVGYRGQTCGIPGPRNWHDVECDGFVDSPRVLSDLVDLLATTEITHLSALRLVFTLPPRVDDLVIGRVLRRLDTTCRLITTPTSQWRKAVEWRLVEERACGSDITDDGVMSW